VKRAEQGEQSPRPQIWQVAVAGVAGCMWQFIA
jgi:hypothetical protein